MSEAISSADANRTFSAVIRHVRRGRSYIVTSHGRPVAKIVPVQADDRVNESARTTLFKRLKTSRIRTAGAWTRDELYERSR